tara:strand:+ start:9771 stop:10028 length:258 start_codon:yes stop_codon:yes gene_type:complete
MARNIPVTICIIRQIPISDPNFHQAERFLGEGKSQRELLAILITGCFFRIGSFIKGLRAQTSRNLWTDRPILLLTKSPTIFIYLK